MKPAVLAFTALILSPAASVAQDSPDADADGMITMEELAAAVPDLTEALFITLDVDANGSLDADEYNAALQGGLLPMPAE